MIPSEKALDLHTFLKYQPSLQGILPKARLLFPELKASRVILSSEGFNVGFSKELADWCFDKPGELDKKFSVKLLSMFKKYLEGTDGGLKMDFTEKDTVRLTSMLSSEAHGKLYEASMYNDDAWNSLTPLEHTPVSLRTPREMGDEERVTLNVLDQDMVFTPEKSCITTILDPQVLEAALKGIEVQEKGDQNPLKHAVTPSFLEQIPKHFVELFKDERLSLGNLPPFLKQQLFFFFYASNDEVRSETQNLQLLLEYVVGGDEMEMFAFQEQYGSVKFAESPQQIYQKIINYWKQTIPLNQPLKDELIDPESKLNRYFLVNGIKAMYNLAGGENP